MGYVQIILAAISAFPQALTEVQNLYAAIKADLSPQDQATIDQAFADAKTSDAAKTAAADAALTAASKT